MHAANRGENITVFFINNGIYGMTGGQLAPTTPVGQRTPTTPRGRDPRNDGFPIQMSEIIATLHAPVLVERVSLATGPKVVKARKIIREALHNQIDGRGFSFVEILSPCPISWKMSPTESRVWMEEHFEKLFPLGNFKRTAVEHAVPNKPVRELPDSRILEVLEIDPNPEPPREARVIEPQQVKIAGFGGQGVVSGGILLAHCAVEEGFETTWIPSYGPEMRGGTANCSVVVSDRRIGTPVVNHPNVLVAMNRPSLEKFEPMMQAGGHLLINKTLIEIPHTRTDVDVAYVEITGLAGDLGNPRLANIVALGALMGRVGLVGRSAVIEALNKELSGKKAALLELNLKALEAGMQAAAVAA
jgi:2-oxoisovalerate ferredoxin oxidoreductase beta subunit